MSTNTSFRTALCAQLNASHIGQTVRLSGWVNRRRDHGGVVFIDLRDHTGLAQIVCDPALPALADSAHRLRSEWVLAVSGVVRARPDGTVNTSLASGEIEVMGEELRILNVAATPPFVLDDDNLHEDTRLSHRHIDLRRPAMQDNLRRRARIAQTVRQFLDGHSFVEIETPMLTRRTPEGARDYLVPGRLKPGHFFALPQSPQLYKQLLMIGGLDRYYQIARCFRDEDLRADRQPEFTQIDCELSFTSEDEIMAVMEDMIRAIVADHSPGPLADKFPRIDYQECMERFGTDRPDLRIPFELVSITDLMREVEFKVFRGPARAEGGRVAMMTVPGGGSLTRSEIDTYTAYVQSLGGKGMAYIRCQNIAGGREGLQSPILKFLPDDVLAAMTERAGAKDGDMIIFAADSAAIVAQTLGALRVRLATDLKLMTGDAWAFLWVVNFPMFARDEHSKRLTSVHHPFTMPVLPPSWLERIERGECLDDIPQSELLALRSRAYDLVVNGMEIGGGSIRLHNSKLQQLVLRWIGLNDDEIADQFGFMIAALDSGAPPHGGIAFGLDRLAMLLCGADSIREVIAFPKTQSATCLTTSAPSTVPTQLLNDLFISVRKPERATATVPPANTTGAGGVATAAGVADNTAGAGGVAGSTGAGGVAGIANGSSSATGSSAPAAGSAASATATGSVADTASNPAGTAGSSTTAAVASGPVALGAGATATTTTTTQSANPVATE